VVDIEDQRRVTQRLGVVQRLCRFFAHCIRRITRC
jgi:hypothetical protein